MRLVCVSFCFPTFFNFSTNVTIFCVAFLVNLFIEFTTYVVKGVTITQGIEGKCYYGWILRHVLSPLLFEWLIRLLCRECDPSLRNVQWPDSILHYTSLVNTTATAIRTSGSICERHEVMNTVCNLSVFSTLAVLIFHDTLPQFNFLGSFHE